VVNKYDLVLNTQTILNPEDSLTNKTSAYKSPVLVKDIKCGGEHTVVLSSYGRVYVFGHGYTGQLGLGNTKNFDRPMIVKSLIRKKIIQIAAGWSHTILLTSEGNLYVTGCGKYGEL
jgi:alpha-tubulin suppressor-like RCC1 family protein